MSIKRRVVVTGMGLITPLGIDKKIIWERILGGQHGITKFQTALPSTVCAKVLPEVYNPSTKDTPRFIDFALTASSLALYDAGLGSIDERNAVGCDENRAGVAIGTGGIVSLDEIIQSSNALEQSYKKLSPYFIPRILVNMASGYVSIKHKFKGPIHSAATACAAGAQSIGDAYNFIRLGYADLMLAGGTDTSTNELAFAGFSRMRALSTESDPNLASRPFDKSRKGFVIGEGCGILVLEDLSAVIKSGREEKILAELVGYGLSADAYHISSPSPDGDGAYRSMMSAFSDANVTISDIGYINAHATSTPLGDGIEAKAIKHLRKQSDLQLHPLYVSSTKGATGHQLGAAGAIESAFTIMALQTGCIPPTLNLIETDEDTDSEGLFHHVTTASQVSNLQMNYALNNSFAFGGINCSLIFGKYRQKK